MRTFALLSAVTLCLAVLPSCSMTKAMTKADLASFKLSDLTRFGQPHIVKVSREEVAELEQAERRSGQVASLAPKYRSRHRQRYDAPSDFVPPTLPDGAIAFDGSILPPKNGGGRAVLDVAGNLPGQAAPSRVYAANHGQPPRFSIE